MCIPTPQVGAAPANPNPSMQSADNLELGGANAPRGAANLGRLMLRLNGNPTGTPPAPSPAPQAAPPPAPSAASTAAPGPSPVASSAASALAAVPNMGLRLGTGRA